MTHTPDRPSENPATALSDGLTPSFADRLIHWQKEHGRHNLPWHSRDPYRVWLSEIMLQQTQVATVAGYYPRFLAAFPTVSALAAAAEDDVLALWQGLGYYSRARNLHKAAKQIMADFGGQFPTERTELEKLCAAIRFRRTAAALHIGAARDGAFFVAFLATRGKILSVRGTSSDCLDAPYRFADLLRCDFRVDQRALRIAIKKI